MKKTIVFAFLILAVLLAACSSTKSTPTAQPTEIPTSQTAEQPTTAPVEQTSTSEQSLTGTAWMWVGFTDPTQQFSVENPASYTLAFQADGTVNIKADCNNAIGSYTLDGQSITIEVGPMTRAMCPPESRSDEFIKNLSSAAIYFFKDGNLFLDLMADGGTMELTPQAPASITGTSKNTSAESLTANPWQWIAFTNPVEQYQITDAQNYLLAFNIDGTLDIKADCNLAGGSYSADGGSLAITIGPMTLAACPPGSRSDDFIKYLGFAAGYFFEGGDLFIDLYADGGTMKFSPQGTTVGTDPLSVIGVDINGEPFSGELFLGGGEEKWLNPTLISALGGTSEGTGIDASSLGEGCSFFIPSRPDVVINWEAQEGVDTLKFFFLSMGDPSLMLVTPSGQIICNDDLNPLVLDPYIEVQNPEAGRYVAFLGSFENDAVYPGFLVTTSLDFNPANMDLGQLFPRQVDPRGVPERLSIDLLEADSPNAAAPTGGKLSSSDLPFTGTFSAGGPIGAFNLDQPNTSCTGFISAVPTFRFEWDDDAQLVMFFESNVDTTLVVRTPDGTFQCNDDFKGSENINPWLSLTPSAGTYYVWVGSFSPDVQAEGTLTITNDANGAPAVLTSEDLP
jgi:heat shock protein HslJ